MANLFYDEEIRVLAVLNEGYSIDQARRILEVDENTIDAAQIKCRLEGGHYWIHGVHGKVCVVGATEGTVQYWLQVPDKPIEERRDTFETFQLGLAELGAYDDWAENRVWSVKTYSFQFRGKVYDGYPDRVTARAILEELKS